MRMRPKRNNRIILRFVIHSIIFTCSVKSIRTCVRTRYLFCSFSAITHFKFFPANWTYFFDKELSTTILSKNINIKLKLVYHVINISLRCSIWWQPKQFTDFVPRRRLVKNFNKQVWSEFCFHTNIYSNLFDLGLNPNQIFYTIRLPKIIKSCTRNRRSANWANFRKLVRQAGFEPATLWLKWSAAEDLNSDLLSIFFLNYQPVTCSTNWAIGA